MCISEMDRVTFLYPGGEIDFLPCRPMKGDAQSAFRALADPTRRQILMDLSTREMTIGEVVDQFDITRGAVKKHLTILEEGKLISVRREGRTRINKLEPMGLKSVSEWLNYFSDFWDERLNALKTAIENENRSEKPKNRKRGKKRNARRNNN